MSEVRVEVLLSCDAAVAEQLSRLLPQVSRSAPPLTMSRVEVLIQSPSTHVVVARLNDAVVAMALLLVCQTFAGDFGFVEEVAVDEAERGRHLSVHLMIGLLRQAEALGLRFVDLTSRPSRIEANNLYRKLGFRVRETNCYRHDLSVIPEPW